MRRAGHAIRRLPPLTDEDWTRLELRLRIRASERSREAATYGALDPPAEILRRCERSFLAFLPFWKFKVRDAVGDRNAPILTFANLWTGQRRFAELMDDRTNAAYPFGPWIFALKAGKLGFSELECAFDGYTLLFRGPNTRVHLFSRDLEASKELRRIVRFGLTHLPKFFGVRLAARTEPGGDNTTSLRLLFGVDDERVLRSYATGENISIDQSAHHVHLDELAHMKHAKGVWEDVQTTVAQDGGTLHIVTRGAGDDAFIRELWDAAEGGRHELRAFFAPWNERDDRDPTWLARETGRNTTVGILHFAPEQPADALQGDEANDFLPLLTWDACFDAALADPERYLLQPGQRGDPLVVALDAAVSGDSFAIIAASRHPERHNDPAIRAVKVFTPESFADGRINFQVVEGWLRVLCQGGCPGEPGLIEAHPIYPPSPGVPVLWNRRDDCGSCRAGLRTEPFNVFRISYDPYQLEDMMQRFRQDGVATVAPFDQAKRRTVADRGLFDAAVQRRLGHNGDRLLREHVGNARVRLQKGEDSKMRIVKKDDKRRVDAVVAASMAVDEVLRLYL